MVFAFRPPPGQTAEDRAAARSPQEGMLYISVALFQTRFRQSSQTRSRIRAARPAKVSFPLLTSIVSASLIAAAGPAARAPAGVPGGDSDDDAGDDHFVLPLSVSDLLSVYIIAQAGLLSYR